MNTAHTRWALHARTARTVAAAGALVLLAACSGSKESRIDSGLKKGAEFVRLGDWDKANIEVRNVLQIDPKNAQAYFINAQVSEAQRDIQRAFGAYSKALELKPDLMDAKVGLARIYLLAGDIPKAEQAVKEVLAADANSIGGRTISAALMSQAGKPQEAMALAQAVIDSQKQAPVDASMVLSGLYAKQGKPAEALAVIEKALKDSPKNLSLLQVAAIIAGSAPKGDPLAAKADSFFMAATQEAPKNNELWRAWAGHHAQRGETDQAEKVLRDAIAAAPGESKRTLDLLGFLATQRGVPAAEKEYLAAIAAKPREMPLRFGLVGLYQGAGRTADAQRVLKEIVELGGDPASQTSAKTQLATYELAAGRTEAGRKLVADVLQLSPRDNAALLLRGKLALQDGKAQDAVIDLRAVAKDQPDSAEAIGLLARAYRAAGEPQLARDVLAEAVRFKPNDVDLRLLLVADMADAKEYRNALTELDAGIRAAPDAVALYEGKAKLAMMQKDLAGAEKALVALKAQFPKQAVGYLQLGKFYAQQNKLDAALTEYDAAAAVAPADPLPYIAGVGLLVGTKRFDDASARIEVRAKADPNNMLHYQMRGDVALARRDTAAAELAYRDVIRVSPSVPVGYVNLARVLGGRNDLVGAIATLEAGEKAVADDASLPMARAEWLVRAKRYDEAIAIYEAVLKRTPDDEVTVNNLAFLLADVKGDRSSVERALALASRFAGSGNPGHLDSLGWIHHKLGQFEKAVPLLQKAVALAPNSPILNLHLGKALVKSGEAAKGKPYLKKAIDSKADLPNIEEAKAMLAQG